MRVTRVYKVARLAACTMISFGAVMVSGGIAGSAPTKAAHVRSSTHPDAGGPATQHGGGEAVHDKWSGSRHPHPVFDDQLRKVTFTVPTPACQPSDPNCQWMLFMNLPKEPGQPVVAVVTGSSGVLTLDYPDYCGWIQADVLIGPTTWVFVSGARHPDFNCVPPTTTTTTTTKPTPATTTPPAVASSTTEPPEVASSSTVPNGSSAIPFTSSSSTTTIANGSAQLPFTGADLKLLVILGGLLILIGGMLLTTVESRRRALRRATVDTMDQVKSGARKTSSWFLGS